MSHRFQPKKVRKNGQLQDRFNPPKTVLSLLDEMQSGYEYESIINCQLAPETDIITDLRKIIGQISAIRGRPCVCYLSNVINTHIKSPTSIDTTDDLPFSEMLDKVSPSEKNIDIILVTPGGYADQVAKFVNKLRPRFDNVGFILPFMAMSAGTIFCLSGDELIMDSRSYIGPIDPQVPTKDGRYVPALAILALINEIQTKGQEKLANRQQPNWTDIQILNNLDAKEVGNAISASKYSIELVTNYLANYKFKNWITHSSTGLPVTSEERLKRAQEIAAQLCNHELWKTHSRGITREMAKTECRLKITHPEDIPGLLDAIRKFWAINYYIFERSPMYKAFISDNYSLVRNEIMMPINN